MSFWSVVVPEAGTNKVLNPSGEASGNFAAHNGATVTRDTAYARFGIYSYKAVLGAANRGVNLTLSALANAIHAVTFYVRGTVTGALQASLDGGANYNAAAVIGGSQGGWVRYGVQIPAAQANGSTALILRDTLDDGTIYFDGAQVEQQSYVTTYVDGDRSGLCRWNGLRHASTSTRSAQERAGGRERDLYDDYGIGVLRDFSGVGMPPLTHNIQPMALQPGALYQSAKVNVRAISLVLEVEGASWQALHQKRQDLIDLFKPDAVRGNQPVVVKYTGANGSRPVYGYFRYEGGLEFGNAAGFSENPIHRLIAVDPFWYEDNQEQAALTVQQSVANAGGAIRRIEGEGVK